MKRAFYVLALMLTLSNDAFAWSSLAHKAVAEAVQIHLDKTTAEAIAKLYSLTELPAGALAKASMWPDQIRALKRYGVKASGLSQAEVPEARQFNEVHPSNHLWHFVNLPLFAPGYPDLMAPDEDPVRHFTRDDDVVHMIQTCIHILEEDWNVDGWTKVQALRWLLHLVEDLHQPLHVTTGYYSTAADDLPHPQLIGDPVEAQQAGVLGDRGGNELLFTASDGNNLHAIWDDCLVEVVAGGTGCKSGSPKPEDIRRLAQWITDRMTESSVEQYRSEGDYHHWAERWATDTLQTAASAKVYAFGRKNGHVLDNQQGEGAIRMTLVGPPSKQQYILNQKSVVGQQLVKAAVRLVDLFHHIAWK